LTLSLLIYIYVFHSYPYPDDFYNKPWGLKHWLEHADPPVQDDSVIALIDPDFVFLRPLTTQLRGLQSNLFHKKLEPELHLVLEFILDYAMKCL
jgi:hypothetical protein